MKIASKKLFLFSNLALVGFLYLFIEYICNGYWCWDLESSITEPFLLSLVGLLPTSVCFLFFRDTVFIKWLKHIAWWYSLIILYVVGEINPYAGGILSLDRGTVALFMMAILFVITLIYAPIMSHRLKKHVDA